MLGQTVGELPWQFICDNWCHLCGIATFLTWHAGAHAQSHDDSALVRSNRARNAMNDKHVLKLQGWADSWLPTTASESTSLVEKRSAGCGAKPRGWENGWEMTCLSAHCVICAWWFRCKMVDINNKWAFWLSLLLLLFIAPTSRTLIREQSDGRREGLT
jgi:hypothetical protein